MKSALALAALILAPSIGAYAETEQPTQPPAATQKTRRFGFGIFPLALLLQGAGLDAEVRVGEKTAIQAGGLYFKQTDVGLYEYHEFYIGPKFSVTNVRGTSGFYVYPGVGYVSSRGRTLEAYGPEVRITGGYELIGVHAFRLLTGIGPRIAWFSDRTSPTLGAAIDFSLGFAF